MAKLQSKELGFGSNTFENVQRFLNTDGTANVDRFGDSWISPSDIFHKLTTMSWKKFLFVVLAIYILVNCFFALLYCSAGIENLGIKPSNPLHNFIEAFFFSTQCYTTVGFGRVNPNGIFTNCLASIESLFGLLSLALATGLLYGRFSRPRAEILTSQNILIAPYKNNINGLMFRIASARKFSMLVENQISVNLGINLLENGELKRRFFSLKLELDRINFLTLSWTIVHPIDEESPLFGKNFKDLEDGRAEIIALFKAFEETTSQAVYDKFSYFYDQIIYGAKFESIIGANKNGQPTLDLTNLNKYELTSLN